MYWWLLTRQYHPSHLYSTIFFIQMVALKHILLWWGKIHTLVVPDVVNLCMYAIHGIPFCWRFFTAKQIPFYNVLMVNYYELWFQAHSLYNSASAREPCEETWKRKAFDIQQTYWGNKCTLDYEKQKVLTNSLKKELVSIRNNFREANKNAETLVSGNDSVRTEKF